MNAEVLLKHFHRLGDAPDAVPRLRRFILDLAVRGKLVVQVKKDESVDLLLKKIEAEKAQLYKAGVISKPKVLPPIEADEEPFELPVTWRWTRMRHVTSDRGQTTPKSKFTYIDVTAIDKEAGVVADAKILEAAGAPSRARKAVAKDDVIYSCVRPTLLNVAIIDQDIKPAPIASTAFAVLNGFGLVLPKYIWITLRSPFMVSCVDKKMRGQAYPSINDGDFSLLPFPLPPLAEQHRIIAKVDELMALCDRLEAAQQEREQRRSSLTAATWQSVVEATDAKATRFALEQLPALTTRPEQVKALRQTILDLAVRGRLVEQDAKEKVPTSIPEVIPQPEDQPFRAPKNWRWTLFENVGDISGGFAFKSPDYSSTGVFVLRVTNIEPSGLINKNDPVFLPAAKVTKEVERFYLNEGDILLVMVGGSLGKIGVVTREILPALLNQNLWRIIPANGEVDRRFLRLIIDFIVSFQRQITRSTHGHLSREAFRAMPVALPPLAEQARIVAKVDALMQLCDALEAALVHGEEVKGRLLEAVLASGEEGQQIGRSENGLQASKAKRVQAKAYPVIEEAMHGQLDPVPTDGSRTGQVKAEYRKGPGRPRKTSTSSSAIAAEAVLSYLNMNSVWRSKSDILEGIDLDPALWNATIKSLLEAGKVERQGEKKGARYKARSR